MRPQEDLGFLVSTDLLCSLGNIISLLLLFMLLLRGFIQYHILLVFHKANIIEMQHMHNFPK
jgi:hypothetical protein